MFPGRALARPGKSLTTPRAGGLVAELARRGTVGGQREALGPIAVHQVRLVDDATHLAFHETPQGLVERGTRPHLLGGLHHVVLSPQALRGGDDVLRGDGHVLEGVGPDEAVARRPAGRLLDEGREEPVHRLEHLLPVDLLREAPLGDRDANELGDALHVQRPDVDDRVEPTGPEHRLRQHLDPVGGHDGDDLDALVLEPVEELQGAGELGEVTILLDDAVDVLDEDHRGPVLDRHVHGVLHGLAGAAVDERPAVGDGDLRGEVAGEGLARAVLPVEDDRPPQRDVVLAHLVRVLEERPDVRLQLLVDVRRVDHVGGLDARQIQEADVGATEEGLAAVDGRLLEPLIDRREDLLDDGLVLPRAVDVHEEDRRTGALVLALVEADLGVLELRDLEVPPGHLLGLARPDLDQLHARRDVAEPAGDRLAVDDAEGLVEDGDGGERPVERAVREGPLELGLRVEAVGLLLQGLDGLVERHAGGEDERRPLELDVIVEAGPGVDGRILLGHCW